MEKDNDNTIRNQKVFVKLVSVLALQARLATFLADAANQTNSDLQRSYAKLRAQGVADAIHLLELPIETPRVF